MTAEIVHLPARPLANFIDAQGHRVTATLTRSGLLAIITRAGEDGIRSGHPCLNPENARELGEALLNWADREVAT